MSTDKWATSKSTQLLTKVWVKLLLLLEMPWTQFWGTLTEKLNPFQAPMQTLTSSSINTQNRSKNYMLIYHGMHWPLCYWPKLSNTLKKQGFGYPGLKFHQNQLKSSPVSEKSVWNYICFSLLTSGLESFGHNSTPSDRPRIKAYCPKF